eukprot:CAMPEP_0183745110 /NCGR_PEP_ID=MMETSP0737-20130205/66073_1 /TAXON_ID=385413 /ORGANISM="Thalassiosira miniscula, Strain CCMP1093" /LENGTH=462 /DNA_ID=CAMNT_0025980769 /DNA_START=777 /DNA_END=2165 /DNA_ORIENTATION=-
MNHAKTNSSKQVQLSGEITKSKPKRPLSAFNLFYRFKRQKVVEALAVRPNAGKDALSSLITAPAGLEYYSPREQEIITPQMLSFLRRETIRKDLKHNLEPKNTKARVHRRDESAINGALSFVELGKWMNFSWKNCDRFAKSVFDELADEGRNRYRLRLQEYNAKVACMNPGEAEAAPRKKLATTKQLPLKKNISAKSLALFPMKGDRSFGGSVTNETAEAMVQLSKPVTNETAEAMVQLSKPDASNGYNRCSLPATKANRAPAPTLLDLLSFKKSPYGQSPRALPSSTTLSALPSALNDSTPQQILPTIFPNSQNEAQERLMLRVRELERHLAGQRIRARIRELEEQMTRQNARDRMFKSMLNNLVSQNKSVAAIPPRPNSSFMEDGLWSLVSASMIHPSVQASERTSMLSRIVERHHEAMPSKRPSPEAMPSKRPSSEIMALLKKSAEGFYEQPAKKQRLG